MTSFALTRQVRAARVIPPACFSTRTNTDGLAVPGDTPSPPTQFYANQVTITEIGPEGNNRAFYTPLPGQPGFVAGFNLEYIFVSNGSVPEPGTIRLMVAGLGPIGFRLIRRRSRA